jgi:ribosomal protein L2
MDCFIASLLAMTECWANAMDHVQHIHGGGNRMTNLGATGKLRKVELRQAFSEHFTKEGA